MSEIKGVIYILTNPSFPAYVKIGYADDIDKLINALTSNSPKISQSIDNVMRTSSNEILKLLSDNGTKLDDVGMKAVSNISKYLANDNISVEDAKTILAYGADKISINSPALADPSLITRLADKFGVSTSTVSKYLKGAK